MQEKKSKKKIEKNKEEDKMDMPEAIETENVDKKIEILQEENKAKTEENEDTKKEKGKCACFIF